MSNDRGVGPLAATVLVAGNMIGSGVFMLPASLAATGSSTILSWLITSAGALALAGVFAALATIRQLVALNLALGLLTIGVAILGRGYS